MDNKNEKIVGGQDEVVKCFFKVLYPNTQVTADMIKTIINKTEMLHRQGWRYQDICNAIVNFDMNQKIDNCDVSLDLNSIVSGKPPLNYKSNLLEDKYYYHGKLQRKSKPSEIYISNQGDIVKKTSPYFLEMIDIFTSNDLMLYFYDKFNVKNNKVINKRNKRELKYLIESYDLDEILFTIDRAKNILKSKNYNLFNRVEYILDYIDEGRKALNKAKDMQTGEKTLYYTAYLKERERSEDNCK